MKLFVLGSSRTGKSPFASRVAAAWGVPCVGASAWVRERFAARGGRADGDRAAFVAAITRFSIDELRRDPDASVRSLRGRVDLGAPCVVEGVRNPYDFVRAFDYRADRAVVLEYAGEGALAPTAFEAGLGVIRAYVDWLAAAGLCDHPLETIRVTDFAELDAAAAAFVARTPPPAPRPADARGDVHVDLPHPIATGVRAEFLYGMDPARIGEVRPCTAFAISSYTGSAPTFQILLADGAMFSYVPAHALVDPATGVVDGPPLELADLVYLDCKSTPIAVTQFAALAGPVLAFFKRVDRWIAGTYQFTVDWFTTNEMLHGIALANGQFALLPSHKVKFGDHAPGFEPYRKIRREWTVE